MNPEKPKRSKNMSAIAAILYEEVDSEQLTTHLRVAVWASANRFVRNLKSSLGLA